MQEKAVPNLVLLECTLAVKNSLQYVGLGQLVLLCVFVEYIDLLAEVLEGDENAVLWIGHL